MNKKLIKIVSTLLMAVMIVSIAVTSMAAIDPSQVTAKETSGDAKMLDVGQKIVGILQTVGIILSVIVLIVVGIKYMMGSVEEKAEYKKTLMPYVIGAALIFAASAFAQVVYGFFTGI